MQFERSNTWLFLALTVILIGYFSPWIAHEAAGLTYIGLEMGEQAKFLPQIRTGEIVASRSLFYLPPITMALALLLTTSHWPNWRWQTWLVRLLAAGISLLAFPALEALGAEPAEWLWRILLIALVLVVLVISPWLRKLPRPTVWLLILIVAVLGAALPAWVYLEVRHAFAHILQQPLAIGLGFWLNVAGHVMAAADAVTTIRG